MSDRKADFDTLRGDFRRYVAAVGLGRKSPALAPAKMRRIRAAAGRALDELGGQPEWPATSLRDYDHARFGPYLGVSGEGAASAAIRDAALASPKVKSLGLTDPLHIGVAHDAERLGSVGELPVGPAEYRDIRLGSVGRVLTSTNVGSRINVRFYGRVRTIWANPAPVRQMIAAARDSARERFAPFLAGPDGKPRPVTVFVRFKRETPPAGRAVVLKALTRELKSGALGSASQHHIGLLVAPPRGAAGVRETLEAIRLAAGSGLRSVAVDGTVREAAEQTLSLPGLLDYFNPGQLRKLYEEADRRGIELTPANTVDTESVARHVWTALVVARNMGAAVGKFGLFPLTVDEAERVIALVQSWFPDWTTAPVFYVDEPVVYRTQVFTRSQVAQALKAWLELMARYQVRVVLVDTVDKSRGMKLLKSGPNDRQGILDARTIQEADRSAAASGIRILWAGGISVAQSYEFGRLRAFGVYVTTAVASSKPVGPEHENDPALAVERLPTKDGVGRVKLLLEAGFLSSKLLTAHAPLATRIDKAARELLASIEQGGGPKAYDLLWKITADGWDVYRKSGFRS